MRALLQKEYGYFQHLGANVQKFFLSCMISGFADPVLYAFLTAFLYRTSHNFVDISLYYSGFYIGLPIAFFLNGHMMRYFSSQILYWAGTIIEGIIIICIIWGNAHGTAALFVWGMLFGIGAGFYWANRNFLTLRVVHAEKRMYYGSLESGVGTLITILAPLLSGGAIVLVAKLLPNGLALSYRLLSLIAFVILFFTGLLIQTMEPVSQSITSVVVRKSSPSWNLLRLFIVNSGILSGILIFFPTLMVFTFLGKEGTLGYVQSLFAAISALVVLFFASRISNRHALFFLGVSIFSLTFGSILFGIFFSALGVVAYLLCDAVGFPFSWAPYNTISFNSIDAEQSLFDYHHFAYVFDQEVFLNIGRLIGMGIFLLCIFTFGSSFALRFSPFILSLLQISQLFFAKKLIKTHSL